MPSLITVDAKGNVYLIPESVLAKHCKKVGAISEKQRKVKGQVQGQDNWFVCQAWINCKIGTPPSE